MANLPVFLVHAALGGGLLTLLTGPLGCFLVWRRMAYFGDALAHAALLGVAMGLFFQLPIALAVLAVGCAVALLLALVRRRDLAQDTLLGILSPGALAAGLIALHLMPGVRVDLAGYLFGDILALSRSDVLILAACVVLALAVLLRQWTALLALTAAPDLAQVDGYRVRRLETLLLVLTALVVAAGVQLAGALLLTALLIIPAAAARPLAQTPAHMAVLASMIGLMAVTMGLALAWQADLPAGPAIVLAAIGLFITAQIIARVKAR